MYLEHWGLQKFPFENVPDPSLYCLSKSREEGLTRLIYAAKMRKGGAMLSGEIGCGKTMLTKVYIHQLPPEQYDVGLIINPRLEPIEFIQEVLYQFDITNVPDTKVHCLHAFNEKMIENMKKKKDTILIIDEAQLLSESTFEEVRLLLNFQLNGRAAITVVLVGQPELGGKIRDIEQLDQRIPIKFHLQPFDYDETTKYITFRQKRAGVKENLFSPEALERIYAITKGVARKINDVCDLSLFVGFTKSEGKIDAAVIDEIVNDGALF
jgi:general secretion pathway protein A